MPSLEDELNALLAGSASLGEGIADAKKVAGRAAVHGLGGGDRRSRKDGRADGHVALVRLVAMSGMGYEDVFEKIDLDKNGTLELNEILAAPTKRRLTWSQSLCSMKKMVCEVKGAAFSGKTPR